MSWVDLYFPARQMTTAWRPGRRACFAAPVCASLCHERRHTAHADDHLRESLRVVASALRMAAGGGVVEEDARGQFNWAKKGRRRSLPSVGREAHSAGLRKGGEVVKALPKLGLRLDDRKIVKGGKPAKSRAQAAAAKS